MDTTSYNDILQKLQNTEEVKCSLERQHNQMTADLSKSDTPADLLLNGFHNDSIGHNGDKPPHQSSLREIEQKMKLENDRYEELMIDLALLKKQGQRQQQYSDLNAATLEGVSDKDVWNNNDIDKLSGLETYASELPRPPPPPPAPGLSTPPTGVSLIDSDVLLNFCSDDLTPPVTSTVSASIPATMAQTIPTAKAMSSQLIINEGSGGHLANLSGLGVGGVEPSATGVTPVTTTTVVPTSGGGGTTILDSLGLTTGHRQSSGGGGMHGRDLKLWSSFDDTIDTRTSIAHIDSSKQGSKSGEDLGSNLNSVMSSPSVDHFVSNLFHQQQNRQSQMNVAGDAGSTTSGEFRAGTGGDGGGYTSDLLTQSAMVAADLASMLPSNSIGLGLEPALSSSSALDMAIDYGGINEIGTDKQLDMLEIPGKGRCFVFLARYSYDPFQQSLNDNPEYELPLSAGDYVLIWGNVDDDGYVEGELLDGRKGLVPSNFIEKLRGEDLLEFHRCAVFATNAVEDEEFETVVPVNLPLDLPVITTPEREIAPIYEEQSYLLNATFLSPEEEEDYMLPENITYNHSGSSRYHRHQGRHQVTTPTGGQIIDNHADISPPPPTAMGLPTEVAGSSVPAPRHLTLERQLNKSILISWSPPEAYHNQIEMYHVYVDGFLRTTVKASDKTKALVEGVDSHRPHRISVRSVLVNRKTSKDAACTMIIGRGAPLGPSCVKASAVTHSSAIISWLPSNSNFQHTVCINNVEVKTLRPGTFKHMITGLTPNTYYKVTVRAKNIKASPYVDEKSLKKLLEKLSAHTEFRTLNKALPDPPMDVRVEGGPQESTILVTWIPVTLNTTVLSDGTVGSSTANKLAPVTGYAVFADGKRVTDVDSPSSDHALIDLGCIGHFNPKLITVRSKSRELLSIDSPAVPILGTAKQTKRGSNKMFGDTRYKVHSSSMPSVHGYRTTSGRRVNARRDPSGQLIIDQDEDNLSDKEMYARNVPAIEITKDSPSEFDQYTDEDYDLRRRSKHLKRRGGRQTSLKDGSRIFVALFDYDPPTMSPNPEACDDELAFSEGQLIKIIGEKDADGFYWGECNGVGGFVPCNMVSEVQVDDDRVLQDMVTTNKYRGGRSSSRFMSRDRWSDVYASNQVRKMIALYDYDPQKLSPNVDAEVELKFTTGDIIYVYGEMDDDGFYLAELRGQRGLVPSNFLADASSNLGGATAAAAAAGTSLQQQQQPGFGQKLKQGVSLGGIIQPGQQHQQQQQQPQQPQQQSGMGGLFGGLFGKKTEQQAQQPQQQQQQQINQPHFQQQQIMGGIQSGLQQPGIGMTTAPMAPQAGMGMQHGIGPAPPMGMVQQQQPMAMAPPAVTAQPAAPAAVAAPPKKTMVDLDRIPGLDDFDDPAAIGVPVAAAPSIAKPATTTGAGIAGAAGATKPGDAAAAGEGGLLGGLMSGITGAASSAAGAATKAGDVGGSAAGAAAGALNMGKGLFKKFGF